jgi:hypothetical protein
MSKHYIILMNHRGSKTAPTEQIEKTLDSLVIDWLRFAPNQYLVYSAVEQQQLYTTVKPLLHVDDSILVLEVSLDNRAGWAPPVAVTWLRKYSP